MKTGGVRSIRTKLLLVLVGAAALIGAAALYGLWLCWNSILVFEVDVEARNGNERLVLATQADFKTQVQEWKNVLLRGGDTASLDKYWSGFEAEERKVQAGAETLRGRIQEPKAKELTAQFLAAHREMGIAYRKGLQAFKDSNFDSKAGDKTVKGMDRAPTELLTQAAHEIATAAHETGKHASISARNAIAASLIAVALAIVATMILFAWLIQKYVVRPANRLVQELGRLAAGDFSVPIEQAGNDEMTRIAVSTEKVRIDLGRIVAETSRTATEVSGAAARISAIVSDVTTASGRQSESTSSTAAAVEQLSVSISAVAHNADEVGALSRESISRAQECESTIEELAVKIVQARTAASGITATVTEFLSNTQAIEQMAKEVRDIADQTNLLALNAAIEAARAGEQGRGFAVVADEVRRLAEKSAETAGQIAKLTQSLESQSGIVQAAVEEGVSALSSSTEYVSTVVGGLSAASEAAVKSGSGIEQITLAVKEQMEASHQIARDVENVAQMVEQTHVSVKEAAQTADDLGRFAGTLQHEVAQFKVA